MYSGIRHVLVACLVAVVGTIEPFPGVKITQVHAEHSSELRWHNPATDKDEVHVGGEPVGFIIELENGFRIYHMGDTSLFGDMKLIAEHYKPDLIMIPIGGHFVMKIHDMKPGETIEF